MVVSICILYWGIEYLKGINLLKPANFYYAKFEKVNGLTVASPVTVNGFKVGQVREITYDYDTNQISVELSFEKGLKIPDGSTIILQRTAWRSCIATEFGRKQNLHGGG